MLDQKLYFRAETVIPYREKESHFIIIKELNHQEDIVLIFLL